VELDLNAQWPREFQNDSAHLRVMRVPIWIITLMVHYFVSFTEKRFEVSGRNTVLANDPHTDRSLLGYGVKFLQFILRIHAQ